MARIVFRNEKKGDGPSVHRQRRGPNGQRPVFIFKGPRTFQYNIENISMAVNDKKE